ncbi:hypothetical protein FN846DRAFT_1024405 [Sphaerosporella brunnea]|uniref:Uncharacterized protein n=1 Tax=Sphaerosporella brunnea TaxID=1250544 RepID=A0A5J5EJE6_9PEZI|nr:hypothetical protein FN846DRAFT_1024405 [Sphaerosporella brunnea]
MGTTISTLMWLHLELHPQLAQQRRTAFQHRRLAQLQQYVAEQEAIMMRLREERDALIRERAEVLATLAQRKKELIDRVIDMLHQLGPVECADRLLALDLPELVLALQEFVSFPEDRHVARREYLRNRGILEHAGLFLHLEGDEFSNAVAAFVQKQAEDIVTNKSVISEGNTDVDVGGFEGLAGK